MMPNFSTDCPGAQIPMRHNENIDKNEENHLHIHMLNMGELREAEIIAPLAMDQPTPEVVDTRSRKLDLPHNMMFMGFLTPIESSSLQDLGGGGITGDRNQPGPSLSISLKEDFSSCTNTPRPERP